MLPLAARADLGSVWGVCVSIPNSSCQGQPKHCLIVLRKYFLCLVNTERGAVDIFTSHLLLHTRVLFYQMQIQTMLVKLVARGTI